MFEATCGKRVVADLEERRATRERWETIRDMSVIYVVHLRWEKIIILNDLAFREGVEIWQNAPAMLP